MSFRIFIFLTLLIVATTSATAEESGIEIWNWAIRDDAGELFAYLPSGEVHLLLTDKNIWVNAVWRFSDDEAIASIQTSGQTAFYRLNPQSAQLLTLNFDIKDLEVPFDATRYGYRLEAYSFPYMLFTPSVSQSSPPSESALLLNLDTNQIELLTNDVYWAANRSCCRFSENGLQLRYPVASGDYEDRTLELRERTLATGEEEILYTLSGNSLFLYPDTHGERWLLSENPPMSGLNTYRILNLDGTSEEVYRETPSEWYWSYDFIQTDLVAYQPLCETDCILKLWTSDGETLVFEMPPGSHSIFPTRRFGDQFIVGRLDGYWLLTTDNKPRLLGYYFCSGCHLPSALSPDKRWLLLADNPVYPQTQLMVWDLSNQEVVVKFPMISKEPIVQMVYGIDGFIMQARHETDSVMYEYRNQAITNLPYKGSGTYFDILPDGSVLYTSYGPTQLPEGIYRYDPQSDTFTLLIANAQQILEPIDVNYYDYS